MGRVNQLHQDTADRYRDWLANGRITETEFRKQMAGLGFDRDQIDGDVSAIYEQTEGR